MCDNNRTQDQVPVGEAAKKMSGNDGNCEAGLRELFRFVAFLPGTQVDEQTGKKVDLYQSY